jgi:enoyl-CoA hydratase/carnithine racemase
MSHLLVERDGPLLIATMNRPERMNALSPEMFARLYDAWREASADDGIRCILLTGAGGHFCSGMDLKALSGKDGDAPDEYTRRMAAERDLPFKALLRAYRPTKPIVAAVEGNAIAGGTEILQGTDIRVAAESARFGVSEVRWGLYPMAGSAVRLRRQIPYTVAAEILLTGKHISAREALAIGLVGHVVPDGRALDKAREIAGQIAENGPLAVEAVLATLHATDGMTEPEAMAYDMQVGLPIFATRDAKEGPRAFAEKRKPDFTRS